MNPVTMISRCLIRESCPKGAMRQIRNNRWSQPVRMCSTPERPNAKNAWKGDGSSATLPSRMLMW